MWPCNSRQGQDVKGQGHDQGLKPKVKAKAGGVVVSGVRRMNEVNSRRARLLPGWVTVFGRIPSRYVTSQLGQLSLASLRGRLIEYYQLRLGLGRV